MHYSSLVQFVLRQSSPCLVQTSVAGWLEAFGAHPRIGDAAALKAKLGGFADMSRLEQAAAGNAPEATYQVGTCLPSSFTLVHGWAAAPFSAACRGCGTGR